MSSLRNLLWIVQINKNLSLDQPWKLYMSSNFSCVIILLWSLILNIPILVSTLCSFGLPLFIGSMIISCFLIKFPISVVSSSFDKKTCFPSSWVVSSLATSFVSSSYLSFSSTYWIHSYITSRTLVLELQTLELCSNLFQQFTHLYWKLFNEFIV